MRLEQAHLPALRRPSAADWMRTVQARIHRDIQAIMPLLNGEQGQAPKATLTEHDAQPQQFERAWLADRPQPGSARQGPFQTGGGLALINIHDITSQLAAELGASVAATQLAGAR